MITCDTSGLFSVLDVRDPNHRRSREALRADRGPFLVPSGILAEITYMIEARLGSGVLDLFLGDLESGAYTLEGGEEDLPRIRALVQRYTDLDLGFADAAVIACAERSGGRVLTLDLRDFGVVAREGKIRVLPE